tara:strand:- start:422 stop:700 length:279 start_codon:yes stop_codon:yes gene_type:complete
MENIKILKNVPYKDTRGRPGKYDLPLDDMEKGDYIQVPFGSKKELDIEKAKVRQILYRFSINSNPITSARVKFKTVLIQEDNEYGLGIWRIA